MGDKLSLYPTAGHNIFVCFSLSVFSFRPLGQIFEVLDGDQSQQNV
jgi:hypothetical protein